MHFCSTERCLPRPVSRPNGCFGNITGRSWRLNRRHRWILWGWLAVYTLVAIQMAWLLRPFVVARTTSVVFLRPEAWDNAYVFVLRLIGRAIGW